MNRDRSAFFLAEVAYPYKHQLVEMQKNNEHNILS